MTMEALRFVRPSVSMVQIPPVAPRRDGKIFVFDLKRKE
jgi:hypothetical protein